MITNCNHLLITSVLTTSPVSKCHIHVTFEHSQGWSFHHFPGQFTPDLVCDTKSTDECSSNNRCTENFRKVQVPTKTNQTEQSWMPASLPTSLLTGAYFKKTRVAFPSMARAIPTPGRLRLMWHLKHMLV